jgi:hypothetical protein
MRALSIRQPYAEQILRGVKTIEYRSRPTRVIGQRFYIYAARTWAGVAGAGGSGAGASGAAGSGAGGSGAGGSGAGHDATGIREGDAPTGVIVGSAVISKCVRNNGHYEWHLTGVKRLKRPRPPHRQPQPVWFRPW